MKKNLLALVLALTFIFPSFAAAQTATKANSPARRAAENITAAQMKDYLYFIASDEMEGRDTPSRGLDLTAKFIAMQLSRWGFKPAGDNGTFFQKIALSRNQIDQSGAQLEINNQKFAYGTDFLTDTTNGTVNAPLVFGGNGWFVKSKNIDAFKGVDVAGKTVVIYTDSLPKGLTQQDIIASGKQGVDWADPATYARQKGAAGLIVVMTPNVQANWANIRRFRERGNLGVVKFREAAAGSGASAGKMPTIYLSQKAAETLFQGETMELAKIAENYNSNTPAALAFSPNKRVSYTVAVKDEAPMTQNVVALWEGSDPTLKAEMVAIGAHYDHVGMNPNAPGPDKIWNGADDDGSGTTGVLAIAEALAKSDKKPKRSILFVWHAGEEKGLWGSEYYAKFPTVDLKNVVAQLNIDMIGRSRKADDTNPKNKDLSGENEIYVIGSKMMSTQLGAVTDSVNKSFLNMTYNFRYDDPADPNRFFFRSDHFNYAAKGIPIVFWFDGVHEDYHQPGDTADKIDYQKMERVTRTIFLTMWELADSKTRPAIDKQLPPELTQR